MIRKYKDISEEYKVYRYEYIDMKVYRYECGGEE